MNHVFETTLEEITRGISGIKSEEVEQFVSSITNCKGNIIGLGAGRMGYALQGFIMRLSHLGKNAFMIGDTTLPRVTKHDLVLVNSSSGATPSIVLYAQQAHSHGAKICLVSAQEKSPISEIAHEIVTYPNIASNQLMKTYHEQLTWVFYDCISQLVFEKLGNSRTSVENNHSVLE